MPNEEVITLDCPYCRAAISQPLRWFKQPYFSCPACNGGLAAGQFETIVRELDDAFDASVEEMLLGKPGCGCGSGGCGSGGCG